MEVRCWNTADATKESFALLGGCNRQFLLPTGIDESSIVFKINCAEIPY